MRFQLASRRAQAGAILLAALLLTASAGGQPPATQPAALNPKVLALADNRWLKLDPPREPDGRNYSGPCLGDGRVFYFGGAHFSYQGNDVDFYDLAANTWTRSWPPQRRPPQDFSGKHGGPETVFSAKTGRPWPVHTYQQVCYVPERKVFFYAGHVGTWQFDPAGMKWTNLAGPYSKGRKPSPHTHLAWQTYHTFYSPQLKAPVCIVTTKPFGVHVYDFDKGEWTQRDGSVPAKMKWYELYSTYVPSLGRHLVSQRGTPFMWTYDAKAERFNELANVPEPLQGCQALACDEANDVVIGLAQFKVRPEARRSKISVQTWVLQPKTLTWGKLATAGPRPEGGMTGSWAPLWYDRAHNAFFFLNRTSQTGCETWAYRYKRVAGLRPPKRAFAPRNRLRPRRRASAAQAGTPGGSAPPTQGGQP